MNPTIQPGMHPDAESLTAFAEQVLPVAEREEILSHFHDEGYEDVDAVMPALLVALLDRLFPDERQKQVGWLGKAAASSRAVKGVSISLAKLSAAIAGPSPPSPSSLSRSPSEVSPITASSSLKISSKPSPRACPRLRATKRN